MPLRLETALFVEVAEWVKYVPDEFETNFDRSEWKSCSGLCNPLWGSQRNSGLDSSFILSVQWFL